MADKSLKSKAISIKGKAYVLVADRINYFNEQYPQGSVETSYELVGDMFIVKASISPNPQGNTGSQTFTGHSQATIGDGMVNKTAALENAETSAVGRALAMMGIGVIDSIASVDEMNKAKGSIGTPTKGKATDKQIKWMLDEAGRKTGNGVDEYNWLEKLLTVKPEDVPSWKVMDAITLIKKQPAPSTKLDTVITDIPDDLNLNDIPY